MKVPFLSTILLMFFAFQGFASPIEMAITVDDLPIHGKLPPGVSRLEIANRMLSVFKKFQVPEVYGFVNAAKFEFEKDQVQVLKVWTQAGYPLGNHTYAHVDMNKVSAQEFNSDISKNENSLKDLSGSSDWKYFRYPYLHEGNDVEKRNAVRKYLFDQGYKIAQVTVDFEDWAWNDPYARCLEKKDVKQIQQLKKSYLKNAKASLEQSRMIARKLFRKPVKQILLLHIGAFDADTLDELLRMYIENGVKFIPLSEAVKDNTYSHDPQFVQQSGDNFLFQIMKERGVAISEIGARPSHFPGKELSQICN